MGTMLCPNPRKKVVSQEATKLNSRSQADSPQVRDWVWQNQATGKKQAEAGWAADMSLK